MVGTEGDVQEGRASSAIHLCLDDPRVAGEVGEGVVVAGFHLARLEAGQEEGGSMDGRCSKNLIRSYLV